MSYEDEVLADNPVGYWQLDELSGTTASDSSGNGRDGTYQGTYTLGQDGVTPGGYGVQFNGGSVQINDDDVWSASTTGELTVEGWIRSSDTNGSLVSKGAGSNYEWDIHRGSGGVGTFKVGNLTTDTGLGSFSFGALSSTTASHLVATIDGTSVVVYKNGVQTDSGTLSGSPSNGTAKVVIADRGDSGEPLVGFVDEVAVYPTALSAAQVAAHYGAASAIPTVPDLTVEISFTGSDTSPAWVDITDYVRSGDTNIGRSREVDQFNAGTGQVLLDNRDRRFDPEYEAGPYFGNLLPMRPMRVRASWLGTVYPLFRGYVDAWPQEYQQSKDATVPLSATDGFKVLQRSDLGTPYVTQVFADSSPTHWWTFGDPEGSGSFADNVLSNQMPAGPALRVTLGTDGIVAGDIGTALTIPIGDPSSGSLGSGGDCVTPTSVNWSFEFWFQTTAASTEFFEFGTGITISTAFAYLNNGQGAGVFDANIGNGSVTGTAALNDGSPHHVVMTATGSSVSLYVDGVLNDTGSRATPTAIDSPGWLGALKGNAVDADVVMQHFILYDGSELDATQVAAHYAAGASLYEGETVGPRANRFLDWVGWPSSLRDIDDGIVELQALRTTVTGQSVLAAIRTLDDTEEGGFYMGTSGSVVLRDRWGIYQDTRSVVSNCTFGDSTGELPFTDLVFSYDDTLLANYASGARTGGNEQVWFNTQSISMYYRAGYSRTTTEELRDVDVLSAVQARVFSYKDPSTRIEQVVVNGQSEANGLGPSDLYPQLLAREIGDRITVVRRPQEVGDAITKSLIIEGVSHSFTPDTWITTWRASPPPGEYNVTSSQSIGGYLILDDTLKGRLDYNRLGF